MLNSFLYISFTCYNLYFYHFHSAVVGSFFLFCHVRFPSLKILFFTLSLLQFPHPLTHPSLRLSIISFLCSVSSVIFHPCSRYIPSLPFFFLSLHSRSVSHSTLFPFLRSSSITSFPFHTILVYPLPRSIPFIIRLLISLPFLSTVPPFSVHTLTLSSPYSLHHPSFPLSFFPHYCSLISPLDILTSSSILLYSLPLSTLPLCPPFVQSIITQSRAKNCLCSEPGMRI